jgi:hypothetical protein
MPTVPAAPERSSHFTTFVCLALAAFGAVAISVMLGTITRSQPTPLATAVAGFNTKASTDPVGYPEPPLTEAEIVAVIQKELPTLQASDDVKRIFADIVRTRKLPPDAMLSAQAQWKLQNGTTYTVWWIQLDVVIGRSYWALKTRQNNTPAAKPAAEPALTRTMRTWLSHTP